MNKKLRGSSGFDRLFHTYLRLLRTWMDGEEGDDDDVGVNGVNVDGDDGRAKGEVRGGERGEGGGGA